MKSTGKYDFPGFRNAGTVAIKALLATTTWAPAILAGPFKPVLDFVIGQLSEWLANKGLLIIDVAAVFIEGELDQSAFDKAIDEALEQVKIPGLTPEQKKAIDDEVIKAFRNFARVTRPDSVRVPSHK